METYSYMNMLLSAMLLHPKQKKSKGFVSNKSRSMIHQVLLLLIRSHVICLVSASSNCRMACRHNMRVKVINLFRNIHVSCSLLELRRRHVVMLQVKVVQVAHIHQLVLMFWRAARSDFLPTLETSPDRSREVPDTSCSNVADGSRQTG